MTDWKHSQGEAISFVPGQIYHIRNRIGELVNFNRWELVVVYRGHHYIEGEVEHVFQMLAENHGAFHERYGVVFSRDEERWTIREGSLDGYDFREIPVSDLPLYVSWDQVYDGYESMMRGV